MTRWKMRGEYGIDTDTLDPGDWLFSYKHPAKWAKVIRASPTAPDFHPCAMDVTVVWEGDSERTHYRVPADRWWFTWAGMHRPVCEHCGKTWPCEPVDMQRQLAAEQHKDRSRCAVCGVSDHGNGASIPLETPDGYVGVWYHTAKYRKACRAGYLRAMAKWQEQQRAAVLS